MTYFVMPAVFASLVKRGLSSDKAWRVSFIVPGILIVTVAILLLLLCPDTPTGKWSERGQTIARTATSQPGQGKTVRIAGSDTPPSPSRDEEKLDEKKINGTESPSEDEQPQVGESYEMDAAQQEVIVKPTWKEAMKVVFSPQTLVLGSVRHTDVGSCPACLLMANNSVTSAHSALSSRSTAF